MGIQAVRTQVFGAATNFTDVYGDGLTRWEQEVWAKPLLVHPGDYQQWVRVFVCFRFYIRLYSGVVYI